MCKWLFERFTNCGHGESVGSVPCEKPGSVECLANPWSLDTQKYAQWCSDCLEHFKICPRIKVWRIFGRNIIEMECDRCEREAEKRQRRTQAEKLEVDVETSSFHGGIEAEKDERNGGPVPVPHQRGVKTEEGGSKDD